MYDSTLGGQLFRFHLVHGWTRGGPPTRSPSCCFLPLFRMPAGYGAHALVRLVGTDRTAGLRPAARMGHVAALQGGSKLVIAFGVDAVRLPAPPNPFLPLTLQLAPAWSMLLSSWLSGSVSRL